MPCSDHLAGIVHEPTQTDGERVDLTVAEVSEIERPGRIDFGGGELEPAETTSHPTVKRDPDDDYGWWHLDAGQYLAEHNESMLDDAPVITIQPHRELLERGATHPTLHVSDLPRIPVAVGGAGLRLKQNARISTVVATR